MDQEADESQAKSQVAQQRVGYDYTPQVIDTSEDHHHHHHEEPKDPGFWKKRVEWKKGLKGNFSKLNEILKFKFF